MAFQISEMTVLRLNNRPEFLRRMKASITTHEGYVTHVAQDLGVGERSVKRWIREFTDLKAHVDKVRAKRAAATA